VAVRLSRHGLPVPSAGLNGRVTSGGIRAYGAFQ